MFLRKTRVIELTDAGRALLADVDPLLASLDAAVAAAERGLGIALVPTFVCERRLRGGRLQRISETEIESGDAYYLVCRPEDGSRPEVRALTSWAISELRR